MPIEKASFGVKPLVLAILKSETQRGVASGFKIAAALA
jgi:hypothetical protein